MDNGCVHCGGPRSSAPSRRLGKYCSNACQQNYKSALKIKKAFAVQSFVGLGDPRTIRRYALLLWGHRCVGCGNENWMGKPIPLVLDHKDGNSDNWSFLNLRLLCCNCDAQTDTYKSKNKGNGR